MTPYEKARQKGMSDSQIIAYMKEKYGNNWVEVAKQKGVPDNLLGVYNQSQTNYNQQKQDFTNILSNIQDTKQFNIPQYQQSMDTDRTMTQGEFKQSEKIAEQHNKEFEAFQTGDARWFAGIARTILDGLNAIGVDIPEANEYINKVIHQLKLDKEKLDKEGYGGWLLAGELAPSIATLRVPIGTKSATGAFTTSALSGYATARADEEDKLSSAGIGALTGTVGLGIYKLIDKLTANKAEKLYNYLKEKYNISDEDAEKAYNNYLHFYKPSDNQYADKVKALIYSMNEHGKALINKAVTEEGIKPATGVIKQTEDLVKSVESKIQPTRPTSEIIKNLNTKAEEIKNNYKQFLDKIGKYEVNSIEITLPEAVDEATMQTHKHLKDLLNSEDLTVDKLIDAYQIASKLARGTRDKVKTLKYNKIKNTIDKELKDILSDTEYAEWRKINQDYYTMSRIYDTPFGNDIKEVVEGKMHPDVLIKKILNSKYSENTTLFESIEKLLGPEQAADFERSLVANLFGKENNKALWNYMYKKLYTKGFVTPEGKELQQLMEKLNDSFNVMDRLRTTLKESRRETVGWSDDLISKAKYSIVTKIWNRLTEMLPTEEAKFQRKIRYLADILSKPSEVKNLISPEEYNKIMDITLNEILDNPENLKEYFDNVADSREKRMILYRNINEITKENLSGIKNKKTKIKLEKAATEMKKAIKLNDFNRFNKSYNEYMRLIHNPNTYRTSYDITSEKISKGINKVKDYIQNKIDKLPKNDKMRKGSIYIGGKNPLLPKSTIDFRYKLDDEIMKLNDNQKYNPEQLKKYLINKGVSPKEIEASGIFRTLNFNNPEIPGKYFLNNLSDEFNKKFGIHIIPYHKYTLNQIKEMILNKIDLFDNDTKLLEDFKKLDKIKEDYLKDKTPNKSLTGKEWKDLVLKQGKHKIQTASVKEPQYSDIRLENTTNYREELDLLPNTEFRKGEDEHFKNEYYKIEIPPKNSVSYEEFLSFIKNKDLDRALKNANIDINDNNIGEFINDFEILAGIQKDDDIIIHPNDYMKFYDYYKSRKKVIPTNMSALGWRRYSTIELPDGKATVLNEIQSDWESRYRRGVSHKDSTEFPITAKKYYSYSIVKGINQAIEDRTNRLIIPIDRENELFGTKGVTKWYESLVTNLNDIKKKLGKQGIKLEINKIDLNDHINIEKEILNKFNSIGGYKSFKEALNNFKTYDDFLKWYDNNEEVFNYLYDIADSQELSKIVQYMKNNFEDGKKRLLKFIYSSDLKPKRAWDIKIDIDPKKKDKAIWYIYSLLGALEVNQMKGGNNESMETR